MHKCIGCPFCEDIDAFSWWCDRDQKWITVAMVLDCPLDRYQQENFLDALF